MKRMYRAAPPGIELLHALRGRKLAFNQYKWLVSAGILCLGMMLMQRCVKSVLKGDRSAFALTPHRALQGDSRVARLLTEDGDEEDVEDVVSFDSAPNGWAPFNGPNGQSLLGETDFAFLGAYAVGMFFAGHLGDRLDLRQFLTGGMLGSGLFVSLFGMGYFWQIHSISYYIFIQVLAGLFQSTGWPSVVSIMANWFGKGKRGLIMGLWNAHTSLGNIAGTVLAASCLGSGWGWSFVVPGTIMMMMALPIWALLLVQPSDIGLPSQDSRSPQGDDDEQDKRGTDREVESVHFMDAWRIPGVSAFAFCLFFSKLVAYVFLYWLPYYIGSTPIEGKILKPKEAGDLSILFDIGGVAGGVLAGHLSDKSGASALVAIAFTLSSVPALYLYRSYGHLSFSVNVALMMASGFLVNGPYALITTAVSADLGTHESLHGNAKALATVTAIIDGMGSIGAAIGPALTGYISDVGGFDSVFLMLYLSAIAAALLLIKVAAKEWQMLKERKTPFAKVPAKEGPMYSQIVNVKI